MAKKGEETPKAAIRAKVKKTTRSSPVSKMSAVKVVMPKKQSVKKVTLKSEQKAGKVPILSRVTTKTKNSPPATEEKHIHAFTTEKKSGVSVPIFRNSMQLALRSPFRFPLDSAKLASQTARFAGVFFVAVGAVLTFLNIQYIEPGHMAGLLQQRATIATYDCTSTTSMSYDATYCSSSTSTSWGPNDTTPDANIRVESPYGTELYGTVPVNITVPIATNVTLLALQKDTNRLLTLGTAVKTSDTTWRFYWQTGQYDVGEYQLKLAIANQYGTYHQTDQSTYFIVLTQPGTTDTQATAGTGGTTTTSGSGDTSTQGGSTTTDTTATTTTNTAATTTTTTNTNTSLPSVSVRLDMDSPVYGTVFAYTKVKGATMLKHFIRPSGSTTFTLLGYASYIGNDEWRYVWDTAQNPNGSYTFKTFVGFVNGSSTVKSLPVDIENTVVSLVSDQTTATTTTVNSDGTVTTTTNTSPLQTSIQIYIPEGTTLEGNADVYVQTTGAQFVELYATPSSSLTPKFIGLAQKINTDTWRYQWDTRNTPNGSYSLTAKVRTSYGDVWSSKFTLKILNDVEPIVTPEQQTYIETLTPSVTADTVASEPVAEIEEDYTVVTHDIDDSNEREQVESLLSEFRTELQGVMDTYARAIRNGDTAAIEGVKADIETLRRKIVDTLPISKERTDIINRIDAYLVEMVESITKLTEEHEAILRDRIGDTLKNDSDKDGITDYDEVNLYKTDPFSADTDGDGFTDGTEILSGYNPRNAASEAYVQYESPKETGIVREDILTVANISSVTEEGGDGGALITGKALPNSFVTLYVFSTPVVVTVKTDTEGNWSYIFDKELDDGTHEVYVGITDNAGRIVAKSNPLAFVKVAQAFTPVDAESQPAQATEVEEPSLLSENIMLLVASIAVVALGLVLILLGIHVNNPRPKIVAIPQQ